eukprot:scaffold13078_cov48-Attheya_sp.AAC.6
MLTVDDGVARVDYFRKRTSSVARVPACDGRPSLAIIYQQLLSYRTEQTEKLAWPNKGSEIVRAAAGCGVHAMIDCGETTGKEEAHYWTSAAVKYGNKKIPSVQSSHSTSPGIMASRVERRRAFQQALQSKDPYRLAAALELSPMAANSSSSSKTSNGNGTYTPSSNESLVAHGAEWGPVLVAWLDACEAAQKGEVGACFEAQAAVHAAFNHLFGGCVGNWLVPALQATCRTTHRMAVLADAAKLRNDHARLQSAVTLLQESFSKTLNDRKEFKPNAPLGEDGSKKAGVLFIVNQLFSMYFRLNTLRLCKNLLRCVELA